jgi:AcrR family transcriptional regulator
VTDCGTANVPISDIADAADFSRRVVYEHFGDRDTLAARSGARPRAGESCFRVL